MRPALFRRREVWLPTAWGALLLLALMLSVAVGLAASAYRLLAPQSPAPGARTLVVEGWLGIGELRQAAAAARSGRYDRVLTSGGPIDRSMDVGDHHDFASRAAARLRAEGLTNLPVIAVPAPAAARERSYVSAQAVRAWVRLNDPTLAALDLYSAGVHARRSWQVYRIAFGAGVEVGVLAALPADHDAQRWWTNSDGAKNLLGETIGLAFTTCCLWPGPPGSQHER